MIKPLLVLTSACLLGGCASKTETPLSNYLLKSPSVLKTEREWGAVRVFAAEYLDASNIQMERADGTLISANYHHWAQSLEQECIRYLSTLLQTTGAPDAPVIEIEIHRFHGDESGRVILEGRWKQETAESEAPSAWQFFKFEEVSSQKGYVSFVETHASLLDQLGAAILAQ